MLYEDYPSFLSAYGYIKYNTKMGACVCACARESVRHKHEDVVQYCYDVMQWRWFYV